MHHWGDENVDWEGIDNATHYIGKNLRRWGRVGAHDKEKYGTVRVYCTFGWCQLRNITHPGWVSGYKWRWLFWLDHYIFYYIIKWSHINHLVLAWQKWLYRYLYRKAIEKYSHLAEEILVCCDQTEWLLDLYDKYNVPKPKTYIDGEWVEVTKKERE